MYQPKAHFRAWEKEYSRKGRLWRYESTADVSRYLKTGNVLEVGCGNGKTLLALSKGDFDITAIDVSEKALELAKKAVGGNPRIAFAQGDLCGLKFGDGSFDGVVCSFVLQHLLEEERTQAVSEMDRVLRPAGSLFVEVFSTEDMRCGKGAEVEPRTFKRETGIITHYFTEEELRKLLRCFVIESLETVREAKTYAGKRYTRAHFRVVCRKQQGKQLKQKKDIVPP